MDTLHNGDNDGGDDDDDDDDDNNNNNNNNTTLTATVTTCKERSCYSYHYQREKLLLKRETASITNCYVMLKELYS